MIKITENGILSLSGLHPSQKEFVKSDKLHTGIVGGYQSGKSTCGTCKTFVKQLMFPGVPCAYYLPTYGLIIDMLVPKFKEMFESLDIPYKYNENKSRITNPYGEIWMRSMHDPDSIISYSVGYSLVDECDVVPTRKMKEAHGRIVSRNSFKTGRSNSIDFVSTPEGFGFMYDFFVKKINENKLLLKLSTLANVDNLGEGYVQGLREAYTEEQLKAYLEGEFVNMTSGTVYRNFNRKENHTDRDVKQYDILHIGMDFNIGKMNAVVHVIDNLKPIAVREIANAYDTNDICVKIKEQFPSHTIVVYPDASGKNRNTSGKSDVEILKSFGFTVRVPSVNPFIRDRVNAMNVAFLDNMGNRNYLVNTDNCPFYTEALELQSYKNGTPDKEGGFDHITEAGGYFIWGNKKKQTISVYAN